MARKYLHISFIFRGLPLTDELENTFGKYFDWLRYSENSWIIYTTLGTKAWKDRIEKVLDKNDSFLILSVDPTVRSGRMSRTVWDWLREERVSEPKLSD